MTTADPTARGRRELGPLKRIVVKLGSSVLLGGNLDALVDEIATVHETTEVVVVTSGAVAQGMDECGLTERPRDLPKVQALAALGQARLMARYADAFARHGLRCAQILITHESLSDRDHFLNVRQTLSEVLGFGAVPVANENDTVATEELRFGDNDRLAAAMGTVVDADLVILLTDVDALYDADPRVSDDARPIHDVLVVDGGVREMAGGAGTPVGTGGMRSKIDAAVLSVEAGIPLILASGSVPGTVQRILDGEVVGTLFHAREDRPTRRRHWIGHLSKVRGTLHIDAGAATALCEKGSSLLAAGVTGVEGHFERGDALVIVGPDGAELARGLSSYDAGELRRIKGERTRRIREILELDAVDPAVHRNNMVLVGGEGER